MALLPTVSMPLETKPEMIQDPRDRDNPNLRTRGIRAIGRPTLIIGVVAVLVMSGLSTWAYGLSGDLSRTRQTLDSTQIDRAASQADLSATRATLTSTTSELQNTRQSLSQEQAARSAAIAQVAQLQKQVASQTGCIQALNGDVAALRQISSLMSDNYNRTAVGSVWARANAARNVANRNALDDYYQGFSSAYNGSYGAANNWIATGNTQITIASQQLAIMNAEIDKVNAANSQIDGAFSAFYARLASTNTTCGF